MAEPEDINTELGNLFVPEDVRQADTYYKTNIEQLQDFAIQNVKPRKSCTETVAAKAIEVFNSIYETKRSGFVPLGFGGWNSIITLHHRLNEALKFLCLTNLPNNKYGPPIYKELRAKIKLKSDTNKTGVHVVYGNVKNPNPNFYLVDDGNNNKPQTKEIIGIIDDITTPELPPNVKLNKLKADQIISIIKAFLIHPTEEALKLNFIDVIRRPINDDEVAIINNFLEDNQIETYNLTFETIQIVK